MERKIETKNKQKYKRDSPNTALYDTCITSTYIKKAVPIRNKYKRFFGVKQSGYK